MSRLAFGCKIITSTTNKGIVYNLPTNMAERQIPDQHIQKIKDTQELIEAARERRWVSIFNDKDNYPGSEKKELIIQEASEMIGVLEAIIHKQFRDAINPEFKALKRDVKSGMVQFESPIGDTLTSIVLMRGSQDQCNFAKFVRVHDYLPDYQKEQAEKTFLLANNVKDGEYPDNYFYYFEPLYLARNPYVSRWTFKRSVERVENSGPTLTFKFNHSDQITEITQFTNASDITQFQFDWKNHNINIDYLKIENPYTTLRGMKLVVSYFLSNDGTWRSRSGLTDQMNLADSVAKIVEGLPLTHYKT